MRSRPRRQLNSIKNTGPQVSDPAHVGNAHMSITLDEVTYRDGEAPLTGFLVDVTDSVVRPGILLVHAAATAFFAEVLS